MVDNIEEQIGNELKAGNYREASNLLTYHPDKTGDLYLFYQATVAAYLEQPINAIETLYGILEQLETRDFKANVYGFIAEIRFNNNMLDESYSDILKAIRLKSDDAMIIDLCQRIQLAMIDQTGPLPFLLQTQEEMGVC